MGKVSNFLKLIVTTITSMFRSAKRTAPYFPKADVNSERLSRGIAVRDWISPAAAQRRWIAQLILKGHYLWACPEHPRKLVVALNQKNANRKLSRIFATEVTNAFVLDYREEWEKEQYHQVLMAIKYSGWKMMGSGRIKTYDKYRFIPQVIPHVNPVTEPVKSPSVI